ncbi:endonuclease domain-containing protein [Geodermatophilus sp. SYSU D00708]
MPPATPLPESLRGRVFRGTDVVDRGLLTPAALRGPSCRRVHRDVYVDARVPDSHRLRARAAARVLLPGAVVSGLSAAVLWGVELADERDDVEVVLGPGAHPRRIPGVRVRRLPLDPDDVRVLDRVRLLSPESATVRAAAVLAPDDAVVAIDRVAVAGLVDLGSIRARVDVPGAASARVRRACRRADGWAESPQETRLRLLVVDSGLPAPVARYVVRHEGHEVARVDFAWPELRIAVEYDGAWHAEPGQFAKDRRRLNRLQAAGWTVVFVTASDLHRPAQLVATIRAALTR